MKDSLLSSEGNDTLNDKLIIHFIKSTSGKSPKLIVYVDDIILTGDDIEEMSRLKQEFATEFESRIWAS